MNNEVAERYAQGLFELSKENKTVKEKKEQCAALLEVLNKDPQFMAVLEAVKISKEEKKSFIESVLSSSMDVDMVRFLKLLVDKGRVHDLRDMLMQFIDIANEELGIVSARVISARLLSDEEYARIEEALSRKTGKHIHLQKTVDPSVLAGIKVVVGNEVTDVTMKTRIESMRNTLLKGGLA